MGVGRGLQNPPSLSPLAGQSLTGMSVLTGKALVENRNVISSSTASSVSRAPSWTPSPVAACHLRLGAHALMTHFLCAGNSPIRPFFGICFLSVLTFHSGMLFCGELGI